MVVEGAPREANVGFAAESPPAEGDLKRDDACALCVPPAAGAAAPKSGLGVLSALVVGVVDSVGLFALLNRPLGAAGVADGALPNEGFEASDGERPPKRPLEVSGWEVVGVVDEAAENDGVVEVPAFDPPKKLGVLDPGG